jgi:Zn finger protein HypA/HybF involved in hydrogenase expression
MMLEQGKLAILESEKLIRDQKEMQIRQQSCNHEYQKITDTYDECPKCGARMHYHNITLEGE